MMEAKDKILSRLQALCSRSECCPLDIQKRLDKAVEAGEITREQAVQLMESLLQDKYVDPERYAHAFVADKSRLQGWGVVKIKNALRMKQVPPQVISRALEARDTDAERVVLEKLILRKDRELKDTDPAVRAAKMIRFVMARGYEYANIRAVLEQLGKNSGNG